MPEPLGLEVTRRMVIDADYGVDGANRTSEKRSQEPMVAEHLSDKYYLLGF